VDYVSKLDATSVSHAVGTPIAISFVSLTDPRFSVVAGEIPINAAVQFLSSTAKTVQIDPSFFASAQVLAIPTSVSTTIVQQDVVGGTSSSFKMFQAGKNIIPHLMARTSEYWVVDTYADAKVLKEWPEKVGLAQVLSITKVSGSSYINSTTLASGVGVYKALTGDFQLPSGFTLASGEVADNPVSVCADDLTPPVVGSTVPLRGSILNAADSYIEFTVADGVGGVDLTTLEVSVSGDITSQPEGTLVVSGGVDQTGGHVLIQGDSVLYLIRYTPTLSWGYNETITVDVAGDDLEPQKDGVDWTCSTPGVVNSFSDSYTVKIQNYSSLGAEIVGLPDSEPPDVYFESPTRSSIDVVAEIPISFYLLDYISGVVVSSINVTVNSTAVIVAGAIAVSGASISPVADGYYIAYIPTDPFEYGTTVTVGVQAVDGSPASNAANVSYSFDIVSGETLVIENFSPAPNTSYMAATKDLSVDVYDNTFGIGDTYFLINGVVASGTRTPLGLAGYTITYHPEDDFDVQGTLRVGVYARNDNTTSPVIKTVIYNLYHGYRVIDSNYEAPRGKEHLYIAARATNTETFVNRLSTVYRVSLYEQPTSDFGASITAVVPWKDMAATMSVISPTHSYGETIDVEVYIEDKDGNSFGPFTFYYTIVGAP